MVSERLTVSQINRYLKFLISGDPKLKTVYVVGEITDFRRNARSGHCYFALKDSESVIRAVMFAGTAQYLRFEPENGMNVLVRAAVTVYERDGSYQLNVNDLVPYGVGAQAVAIEQLKRKLLAEGIFDEAHKKPLPKLPQTIAVITSKNGAALQDILNILGRRMPQVTVLLYAVSVQGENCPTDVVAALKDISSHRRADEVIIARGGGSQEDLKFFNDARIAYAVYDCPIPVISAVGHETDVTICDLAADLRAPTPSAAAELAGSVADETAQRMRQLTSLAHRALQQKYTAAQERLFRYALPSIQRALDDRVRLLSQREDVACSYAQRIMAEKLRGRQQKLESLCARAEAVNPFSVLRRGYAVIGDEQGKTLRSVTEFVPGQTVNVRMQDGKIKLRVPETEEL